MCVISRRSAYDRLDFSRCGPGSPLPVDPSGLSRRPCAPDRGTQAVAFLAWVVRRRADKSPLPAGAWIGASRAKAHASRRGTPFQPDAPASGSAAPLRRRRAWIALAAGSWPGGGRTAQPDGARAARNTCASRSQGRRPASDRVYGKCAFGLPGQPAPPCSAFPAAMLAGNSWHDRRRATAVAASAAANAATPDGPRRRGRLCGFARGPARSAPAPYRLPCSPRAG